MAKSTVRHYKEVIVYCLKMQQPTRESGFPQPFTTQPVCAPPLASSWIRPVYGFIINAVVRKAKIIALLSHLLITRLTCYVPCVMQLFIYGI